MSAISSSELFSVQQLCPQNYFLGFGRLIVKIDHKLLHQTTPERQHVPISTLVKRVAKVVFGPHLLLGLQISLAVEQLQK